MSQLLYHHDPMVLKESFSAAHGSFATFGDQSETVVYSDQRRSACNRAISKRQARTKASAAAVVVKSPGHRDVMLRGELDGNRHSGRAGVASSSGIQESPSGSRYGSGGMTGGRD